MSTAVVSPPKLKPSTDLGRRLLALIKAKGHANIHAAARATETVSYQQLYDIVKGQDPKISTVERIVKALGGTMTELYRPLPEEENPQKNG